MREGRLSKSAGSRYSYPCGCVYDIWFEQRDIAKCHEHSSLDEQIIEGKIMTTFIKMTKVGTNSSGQSETTPCMINIDEIVEVAKVPLTTAPYAEGARTQITFAGSALSPSFAYHYADDYDHIVEILSNPKKKFYQIQRSI